MSKIPEDFEVIADYRKPTERPQDGRIRAGQSPSSKVGFQKALFRARVRSAMTPRRDNPRLALRSFDGGSE